MSTIHPPTERYACSFCDEEFPAGQAHFGSYCSPECYYRRQGRDIFRTIKQDQRWCATCFRPIKDIEQWPQHLLEQMGPETHKAARSSGFQHKTDNTTWVVDQRDAPNTFVPLEHSRWGCGCGAVDPSTESDILRRIHAEMVIDSLLACLTRLYEEDNVPHQPSRAKLFDALREHPYDWEYAAGRAIYAEYGPLLPVDPRVCGEGLLTCGPREHP